MKSYGPHKRAQNMRTTNHHTCFSPTFLYCCCELVSLWATFKYCLPTAYHHHHHNHQYRRVSLSTTPTTITTTNSSLMFLYICVLITRTTNNMSPPPPPPPPLDHTDVTVCYGFLRALATVFVLRVPQTHSLYVYVCVFSRFWLIYKLWFFQWTSSRFMICHRFLFDEIKRRTSKLCLIKSWLCERSWRTTVLCPLKEEDCYKSHHDNFFYYITQHCCYSLTKTVVSSYHFVKLENWKLN